MSFCLIPDKVEDFKRALKDRTINIADLIHMTTEERTALLREYAGDNVKDVNTLFEEKLVLKNQMQGIKNWASKVGGIGRYSEKGQAAIERTLSEYRAAQQERIFSPKQNEAFLNDLADKKLGVHISQDMAEKVFELSAKADSLKTVNPKMSGVSDEYLSAKRELNDYVDSLKTTSVLGSIGRNLATIGRNNLLANPSTPIKTLIGQIVNSRMDRITRRIGNRSFSVGNRDLVRQANTEAWQTFRKTGFNTTSAEGGKLGEGQSFANPAGADRPGLIMGAIEKGVRKTAQLSNKIVIDWEHNLAFTKFYQKTFFDSANLISTSIAKDEGLSGEARATRAAEIFKDAARLEPETQAGAMVRMESQKQAARVTSTNPTLVSRLSLGAKKWLNSVSPGFPLGDLLIPIAKIPANIIANGIENAGVGIPLGIKSIYEGRIKIQSDDLATRYEGMGQLASGIQKVARTVGVFTAAAYFASQLNKDDFRSDPFGSHFVKIGNIWINMEYINAISPALAGMMEVKRVGKPGQRIGETAGQYVSGALQGAKNIPGLDEANKLVQAITTSDYAKGVMKYAKNFFDSRGEPAFIKRLTGDRPIERLFFGATGVETTQEVKQDAALRAQKAAAARAKH